MRDREIVIKRERMRESERMREKERERVFVCVFVRACRSVCVCVVSTIQFSRDLFPGHNFLKKKKR